MKRSRLYVVLALFSVLLVACGITGDRVQGDPGQAPDVIAERGEPGKAPKVGTSEGVQYSSLTTLSSTAVIYGPTDFVRGTGKPETETTTFSASPGEYTLVLINGPDGLERSSSALIHLNGEALVGPSEFNQQIGLITKEITLTNQNDLSVEVRGEPGATVRLQIEGEELPLKVSGKVITADGAAAGGANVTLNFASGETYQTMTDSGGLFAFDDLSVAGDFTLEATSANGLLYGSMVSSISADLPQVDMTLVVAERGPGVVSGRVYAHDGQLVSGADVTVVFSETAYTKAGKSGADGSYSLSGLPADGSFSVTAFDGVNKTSGSVIAYIVPSSPAASVDITLDPPPTALTTFSNGDFSDGTLGGWQTKGAVQIVSKSAAFPELANAAGLATQDSSYAAVASTAGDSNAVGEMSQPFLAESCHTHLQGKVRFISNEWPTWYGTQYNDAYIVKLVTPSGARVLTQGNLNSSSWSGGLLGYNGATPIVEIEEDISAFAGSDDPLTIEIQVSDVGDMIIDSAMAVADFQVIDKDQLNLAENVLGTLSSNDHVHLSEVTFSAPSVLSYVMPDSFVPAGVSTPYTFEEGDSLVVVTRESDLEGGAVTFEVPVQVLDSSGNPLDLSSEKKIYFRDVESEPTAITGGVARVPVKVPAGSGVEDINLNNIEITAEEGVGTQNADVCEAVVPINFTGELPNKQIGSDVGNDVEGWFGDLGVDWSAVGTMLKFVYDLIPLVGDGTELVVQLFNYLTGRDVDEVSAALSIVGFALDLPTDPGTVSAGVAVSGAKWMYKLSKAGAGTIADAIATLVRNFDLRQTREIADAMTDLFGSTVKLIWDCGPSCVGKLDTAAKGLADETGAAADIAVRRTNDAVSQADDVGHSAEDFLNFASEADPRVAKDNVVDVFKTCASFSNLVLPGSLTPQASSNCPSKALIQQFEATFGAGGVHGLRRHGPGTTLAQQKYRARTGLTPDQVQLSPTDATRFVDYDDMYEAMQRAAAEYASSPRGYVEIDMSDLGRTIGEGFRQGGRVADFATTTRVGAQFNNAGELVSIYPKLP